MARALGHMLYIGLYRENVKNSTNEQFRATMALLFIICCIQDMAFVSFNILHVLYLCIHHSSQVGPSVWLTDILVAGSHTGNDLCRDGIHWHR